MKARLAEHSIELLIVLVGLAAATAEAVLTDRVDISVLIGVTAALLALTTIAIREEIRQQVGSAFAERRILESIPDPRWRREAVAELEQLKLTFAGWSHGTRRIREQSSLNFQIDSLATARRSIAAIHVAVYGGTIEMWDDPNRGFDRLVDAYRALGSGVHKRRILIFDPDDDSLSEPNGTGRTLTSASAIRVCSMQAARVEDGGLGFEVRVLWRRISEKIPPNQLIVDNREACSIENMGGDRFTELEVCVNPTLVEYHVRRFDDLWTAATPLQHCLPAAAQTGSSSVAAGEHQGRIQSADPAEQVTV